MGPDDFQTGCYPGVKWQAKISGGGRTAGSGRIHRTGTAVFRKMRAADPTSFSVRVLLPVCD